MNSKTPATHTPGPWRGKRHLATGNIVVVTDPYAGPVPGAITRNFLIATIPVHKQAFGDAQLIAAAPELLAALRDIVDNHVDFDDNGDCGWCGRTLPMYEFSSLCDSDDCAGAKARAAIAKATGGPA